MGRGRGVRSYPTTPFSNWALRRCVHSRPRPRQAGKEEGCHLLLMSRTLGMLRAPSNEWPGHSLSAESLRSVGCQPSSSATSSPCTGTCPFPLRRRHKGRIFVNCCGFVWQEATSTTISLAFQVVVMPKHFHYINRQQV